MIEKTCRPGSGLVGRCASQPFPDTGRFLTHIPGDLGGEGRAAQRRVGAQHFRRIVLCPWQSACWAVWLWVLTKIIRASSIQACVSCGWALCAIARATRRGHLVRSVVDMLVVFWNWWVSWWWLSLKKFVPRRSRGRSQGSDFQCGRLCGVPDRDGRYFKVPGRCKTLIGSNEGSRTHDRWCEGRQWCRENRRATGRQHLGLRKRTVTKCASAGRSARRIRGPRTEHVARESDLMTSVADY